jgi:hypothetical protein
MLMAWRKHALLGACTAVVSKELKLLSNSCFLKRPIYLVPVWKQEYSLTVVDETEDGEATPWTTFMNNVVKQL